MKKSLIALAVLGGFSGMAAAQSSVTLFGIVDLGGKYVKNDGSSNRKSLAHGGINTSRLGLRGVEDLGGGLSAGFWLEGTLTPDDGTAGGQSWQRRSTVSLQGGFGEVRLGRDYTPTFLNYALFDPFGVNGVGALTNIARFSAPNGPNTVPQITFIRSSNSIGYFLPPNLGGIYGQAMVAAGEGAAGKYVGGRIGFARGPFNVAAAYGKQDTNAAGTTEYTTANVAGSWNVGFATLMAQFSQQKNKFRRRRTRRSDSGSSAPSCRWARVKSTPRLRVRMRAAGVPASAPPTPTRLRWAMSTTCPSAPRCTRRAPASTTRAAKPSAPLPAPHRQAAPPRAGSPRVSKPASGIRSERHRRPGLPPSATGGKRVTTLPTLRLSKMETTT